jgi:glycosyltransferase involved in cell wall biosynthesis
MKGLRRRAARGSAPTDREGGPRILCFATQGHGHADDMRMRSLLTAFEPSVYPFARSHKIRSALALFGAVRAQRPALIVMEGTGAAGGLSLLAIDALLGVPYIVSSGDAIAPFLRLHSRAIGSLGGLYERLLYRRSAGFVGWTPYLVGRALTFGAPRAMTAPGWTRTHPRDGARERVRDRLGIPHDALVVGLVGSLNWNNRVRYTYGLELVQAIGAVKRPDVIVCVVGDGSGLERLAELAGDELGTRVVLPGRVAPEEVMDYLAAFDVASLPQSVDGVGSFRYTIKLSEYLAAELPIVTGEIPAAYDLDEGYMWRLPGPAPWSATYIRALTELMEGLSASAVRERRQAIAQRHAEPFDEQAQRRRMTAFVGDILALRGTAADG